MVSPAVGTARWNAVATLNQKALGSLSAGSSDTQTGIRPSEAEASQAASSVVLPNPGGAEMSVTLACVARRNRSESRSRRTRDSRGRGTKNFVSGRVRATRQGIAGANEWRPFAGALKTTDPGQGMLRDYPRSARPDW